MSSVSWRDDDEETAVRGEVDDVIGRLTRNWAASREGDHGVGTTGRRNDDATVDLDAALDVDARGSPAKYLHRSAVDEEVRAVLDSMRRATLDLKPAHLSAMKLRRERDDDGASDRVRIDRNAPEPYVMKNVFPPWYAKTYYKVVARVRRETRETFVSIYDGVTAYQPGTAVCHPSRPDHRGGLYVSKTIEGCLRRDRDLFPECSALLDAPRAVAKVRCWNPERRDDPIFYGTKLAFTCVFVEELLPYPVTWREASPPEKSGAGRKSPETKRSPETKKKTNALLKYAPSVYSPGSSGSVSPGSPLREPTRSKSVSPKMVSSGSPNADGADVAKAEREYDSLLKAQAATVSLEEEVRAMERRLERARFGSRR
jgi:hypothetical protein